MDNIDLKIEIIAEYFNQACNHEGIQARIEELPETTIDSIFKDLRDLGVLDLELSPKMRDLLVKLHARVT